MDVDQILKGVDPRIRRLAEGVRRVIRQAAPEMQEFVKRGAPTYVANGRNAACIMIYKDHVNLGFYQGAKMKSKRLEGTGKGLRRVKVRRLEDTDEREFSRLLREAVELAKRDGAGQ
ncbi:MAG: DUF1801 domain-containing protein [Nitrososphaerales archaeon]